MKLFGWGDGDQDKKGGAVRRKDNAARRLRRKMKRLRGRRRRAERARQNRPSGGGGSAPEFAQALLDLHNEARPKNYRLNADLCQSAQARAEKMDRENRMYHESDWYKRIRDAGYDERGCAENLGEGFSSLESLMKAWLNSPAHRKNVMGPYDDIGFGQSGGYYCAHFGSQ